MKSTFVLTLLVAAFAAVSVDATCSSTCKSRVMSFMEGDCLTWRNRLPRPDLYSRCQDGYALGTALALSSGSLHSLMAFSLLLFRSRGRM